MSQNRSFSGKSALVHDRKEHRKEEVDAFRCSRCNIPIMPDTGILYCVITDCPKTEKRRPTKEQKQQYGLPDWK